MKNICCIKISQFLLFFYNFFPSDFFYFFFHSVCSKEKKRQHEIEKTEKHFNNSQPQKKSTNADSKKRNEGYTHR